jgi:beige protein homolog 1
MDRMRTTNYLCRLEPFSYSALAFTDFKEDTRFFKSFEDTWHVDIHGEDTATTELIPEFFYFPEVLMNMNCFWLNYTKVVGTPYSKSNNEVFLP